MWSSCSNVEFAKINNEENFNAKAKIALDLAHCKSSYHSLTEATQQCPLFNVWCSAWFIVSDEYVNGIGIQASNHHCFTNCKTQQCSNYNSVFNQVCPCLDNRATSHVTAAGPLLQEAVQDVDTWHESTEANVQVLPVVATISSDPLTMPLERIVLLVALLGLVLGLLSMVLRRALGSPLNLSATKEKKEQTIVRGEGSADA